MKKKYYLNQHVHSCFAGFSSSDAYLYKQVTKAVAEKAIKEHKLNKGSRSEDEGILVVYLPADKTFYNRALNEQNFLGGGYYNKPEYKKLVKSYEAKGFKDGTPEAVTEFRTRQNKKRESNRKRCGFVLYKDDFKDQVPADYQGGFSDELFNQPKLKEYVQQGVCFGYIGHSVRKKSIDRYLEKRFMELTAMSTLNKAEILACWLTSTDGRHFGDSLEGTTLKNQKRKIDDSIKAIYNAGFIFNLSEHEGNLSSTTKLREKYSEYLFKFL